MPYVKHLVVYFNLDNKRDKMILNSIIELSQLTSTPVSVLVKNIILNYLNNQKSSPNQKITNQKQICKSGDNLNNQPSITQNENQNEDNINDTIMGLGLKD
jgi:hypothetical protein